MRVLTDTVVHRMASKGGAGKMPDDIVLTTIQVHGFDDDLHARGTLRPAKQTFRLKR